MRVGVFELVDPPPGQVDVIRGVLRNIRFPWLRLLPAIWRDPEQSVIVRWDQKMQQGATGLFYGSTYEIHLGTRYAGWERSVPFVFAHEVGHLVDRATLDYYERQDLTKLLHDSPETYRRDDDRINDLPYEYAHSQEHNEEWTKRDKHYYLMLNEAYADLFVAAFAPLIWEGRNVRFTHWTSDLDAVREITLRREILAFKDVEGNTHQKDIEDLATVGIAKGNRDGNFGPNAPVTRAQMAAFLARTLDQVMPEWRPTQD